MSEDIEEIRRRMTEKLMSPGGPGKSAHPQVLTDGTFASFVSDSKLTIVDFWAVWCAPCRFVSPIIEDLAGQYAGRVNFGKLDVDQNQVTSARYGIRSIPTIMFFKNGKPVDVVVGSVPKNHLESKILQHMQ